MFNINIYLLIFLFYVFDITKFQDMLAHIKRKRMEGFLPIAFKGGVSGLIKRQVVSNLLSVDDDAKLGDWKIEYSNIGDRNFYKNEKTGETRWDMPEGALLFIVIVYYCCIIIIVYHYNYYYYSLFIVTFFLEFTFLFFPHYFSN